MRKRFTADQWTAWFAEFERSGLSVTDFCLKIDVNQNAFYRWRNKLKPNSTTSSEQSFVSVVLPNTNQVTIEFACGAILRVDNHCQSLRPVLKTLVELAGEQQ